MNSSSIAASCAWTLSDFNLNNQSLANAKDGQRQFSVLQFSVQRLHMLNAHVSRYLVPVKNLKLSRVLEPLLWGVLLFPLFQSIAEEHIKKASKNVTGRITLKLRAAKCIVKIDKVLKSVGQHSNKLANAACLASYVALLVLGFYPAGIIGLSGLLLTAIKHYGKLPAVIDRHLDVILCIANFVTMFTLPMHLTLRVVNVLLLAISAESTILSDPWIARHLPKSISQPIYGRHKVDQKKTDSQIFRFFTQSKTPGLTVNKTYVYSKHFRLLPSYQDNLSKEERKRQVTECFTQLDQKISDKNIPLDKKQKEGLEKIRSCLIDGHVCDLTPPNFGLFQNYMTAYIKFVIKDEKNFLVQIPELALLGNSCVEGWTRDITQKLIPETDDINLAVHYELAKWRSAVINEKIGELARAEGLAVPDLKNGGGEDDVHITNTVHSALVHRFRSFEGELNSQLQKKSAVMTLFKRSVLPNAVSPASLKAGNMKNWVEQIQLSFHVQFQGGLYNQLAFLTDHLISDIDLSCSSADTMVDMVYEAIRPDFMNDGFRKISWSAVQSWQADIVSRLQKNV